MTENEAIIEEANEIAKGRMYATKALIECQKELEQYRAIGTVEECAEMQVQYHNYFHKVREYQKIGTVDELKALKEKSVAKKPIRNDLCTCPSCGTHNEIIKKRRNTVAFDTAYCWHCGQAIEVKRD